MSATTRVTDRLVAAYADDLAQMVVALGPPDTNAFWTTLKRQLAPSQLQEAVEAFRRDGSNTVLEQLMATPEALRKPSGYWQDFANVEAELRRIHKNVGRPPLDSDLRKAGLTSLSNALSWHGGRAAVYKRIGFSVHQRSKGYWQKWENLERELLNVTSELGHFPSEAELTKRGFASAGDAIRRFGGAAAVRQRIGVALDEQPTDNRWLKTRARVRQMIADLGRFPEEADVQVLGEETFVADLEALGGLQAVAGRMGLDNPEATKEYWGHWPNAEWKLRVLTQRFGRFPTHEELRLHAPSALRDAIMQIHGGFRAVRERVGADQASVASGHWQSWETCERVLREMMAELGHFPSSAELSARGQFGLRRAVIHEYGGFEAVRTRMGIPLSRTALGTWQDVTRVEETLRRVIAIVGHFPSQKEVVQHAGGGVADAIGKKHGGLGGMRKRLGYVAVTDEHIAAHADVLAVVIPHFRDPAPLWTAMKRQWLERDLDAAVAEFTASGSLVRFEALMNG